MEVKIIKIKNNKILIFLIIIIIFYIFMYFYKDYRNVILCVGNEKKYIEEVIKVLENNYITYKIKVKFSKQLQTNEIIEYIYIYIASKNFEKASIAIKNKYN